MTRLFSKGDNYMTKPNLILAAVQGYIKSYKLMAPNLFDYLQLVEFVNEHKSYFFSISPDKQTLTIYVYVHSYIVTELMALLPAGMVMEQD